MTPSPHPSPTVVGPFVGALGARKVRICLGLPGSDHETVTCSLTAGDTGERMLESRSSHGELRVFAFDFEDLDPQTWYRYALSVGGEPLDLEGLEAEDLRFRPIGEAGDDDGFVLLSCHNPFELKHGDGWAMWRRLLERLEADPSIRLLVLGGDQVYHDTVERQFMPRLAAEPDNEALAGELRRAFIANYQKFWGDLAYRKVLARIPSVVMWDDHDITDGWGGRPESFDAADELRPEWRRYFEVAREAFVAYQASRNPTTLDGVPQGSFTTCLDWGPNRFYLCDFRSEKNSHQQRFWSVAQERAFFDSLQTCTAERIFVLSPVVPFRPDPSLEEVLVSATELAWEARQSAQQAAEPTGWLQRLARWFLRMFGKASTLTDDLEDALMAKCNRAAFLRLLGALFEARRKGIDVVVLSGDIHTAGVSEFSLTENGRVWTIAQVVSSPIAYEPMPAKVEGMTTAVKQVTVEEVDGTKITARNGPYIPDRNFVKITPARLRDYARGLPLEFHFEHHDQPLAMPAVLSPLDVGVV